MRVLPAAGYDRKISIKQSDGKDGFIIFDEKYYLIQLEKGRVLHGNPGIGDVTKQYLYQLAYKKFIADHKAEK